MGVALIMQVQHSDAPCLCTKDEKLFLEFCRLVFRGEAHSDPIAQRPHATPKKSMTVSPGDVGVVTLPEVGKTATSTLPRSPLGDWLPCLLRTDNLSRPSDAILDPLSHSGMSILSEGSAGKKLPRLHTSIGMARRMGSYVIEDSRCGRLFSQH